MKPEIVANVDIYQTAHFLVQQRGTFAKWAAARRAEALLELGDIKGHQTFMRVADAVAEMNRLPT
jgi:hypothetical protein